MIKSNTGINNSIGYSGRSGLHRRTSRGGGAGGGAAATQHLGSSIFWAMTKSWAESEVHWPAATSKVHLYALCVRLLGLHE